MEYKTDEHGQVSMDLGTVTRQRIELPKAEKKEQKKQETEEPGRRVVCPHGMQLQSIISLIMGEEYCRERCGRIGLNSYECNQNTCECFWIKRKAEYGRTTSTQGNL